MPTQIELVKELKTDSSNWHKKYPWFSLGQLINVSNKKEQSKSQSSAQFVAIYFNNVQRLHWLLNEQSFDKNKILNDLTVPVSTESMQNTPQPFPKREHPHEVTAPTHLIAIAAVEEADAVMPDSIPLVALNENILVGDVIIHNGKILDNTNLPDRTTAKQNLDDIEINKRSEQPNIYIQQPEEIKEVLESGNAVIPVEARKPTEEISPISISVQKVDNIEDKYSDDNKYLNTVDKQEDVLKSELNIKAILDGSDALSISFEPYHTIDYFASQGIKVDLKTDDRLGKQLKSFTSWLKSMKRLPITEETVTDGPSEQLQDKSLENINIITEAMAAVLLKQGKKEQAVEIFNKLSLLHPEKSRYFAAQIEQIKN